MRSLSSFVAVAVLVVACSSSGTPSGDAGADGGAGCCPADAKPNCCMNFGGWSQNGGCGMTCDGMPLPNDPGWKLDKDSHGCSIWTHPAGTYPIDNLPRCGVKLFDAGGDAMDASAD